MPWQILADPMRLCAMFSFVAFLLFLAEGVAATILHNHSILLGTAVLHCLAVFPLLLLLNVILITNRRKGRSYDTNLVNTTLTCLLAIVACGILFPLVWYPALNDETLHIAVQDMAKVQFPAVAWISLKERSDSATLYDNPHPKGVLSDSFGGFDLNISQCANQTPEKILDAHYCNCSEMFSKVRSYPSPFHTNGFDVLNFLPTAVMQLNNTNASLVLQIFPKHNTSSVRDGWPIPGPSLLLMVYDATLPLLEAFTYELASVTALPVLASTRIVVSPTYRVGWGREAYYYYKLETSSVPYLNDVCDQKLHPGHWCYTTVVVQLADLTRTVLKRQKATSPGDVFAQAGGYFAFVQLFCWIVSGMAFRKEVKR